MKGNNSMVKTMNQTSTLKDLIKKRTQLSTDREIVKPVNLYNNSESQLKPESKQTSKNTNSQKPPLKKFSSYLNPETIKNLKRLAIEKDKKDYEILQEAVEEYINNMKS